MEIEKIREKFKFDTSIRHNPKLELELLPYNTKFKETQFNFREVMGEFIRLVGQKRLSNTVNIAELIERVINSIEFENLNQKSEFKQMIKTLFLDDNNQLYLFHPKTLYYINTEENENRKLAVFLFNVLWTDEETLDIEKINNASNDLMSELLFRSLPELDDYSERPQNYAVLLPSISRLFSEDFKWLATKSELFTAQAEKLISYYYFFYVSQFAIINDLMFSEIEKDIRPIYFTFENEEKLSKSRVSYEYGWRNVELSVKKMFSHVNLLKMLNISDPNSKVYSYQSIAEQIRQMNQEELGELEGELDKLIEEYKSKLPDSKWHLLGTVAEPYDLSVFNKIYLLLNIIDHQFNQTARSKPYSEYKQWFVHFCQKTFLKSRGRAGKMLILDTEYLLFLTKVIIKDSPKIRLKMLFEQFESRGMIFDRDTQSAIVDYFEKLNLIEKKSDSGDAIYVKSFL